MSYQYPLPPVHHATRDAPVAVPLAYMPPYDIYPGHESDKLDKDSEPPRPLRERKEAISQGHQKLKRSASTNDASMSRQPETSPAQTALSGDKKRNKLGYHRTSVACVHCRRRKIRCIVETVDKTGACVNCVRLKKDCSFHSADHTMVLDSRSKTSSRASTGPTAASASSSPAPASAINSASEPTNPQFQSLAMATPHQVPQLSSDSELEPDMYGHSSKGLHGAGSVSRPFEFSQQPLVNWTAPDNSPASTPKSIDLSMPWRPFPGHESPMTPSFSPYTPNAPLPSASWGAPVPEGPPRDDVAWGAYAPAHPRSTPFAGDGRNSPHSSFVPGPVRPIERRVADPVGEGYASPAGANMAGDAGMAGTAMAQNLPPAAATVPSNDYGAWHPQHQFQYARPHPGVAGWAYGQPIGMDIPTSDQIPTTPESGQANPMGMYYAGK